MTIRTHPTVEIFDQWSKNINRFFNEDYSDTTNQQITLGNDRRVSQAPQVSGSNLSPRADGSIVNAINNSMGKVAPGSPNANCAYTVGYIYDQAFGKGISRKFGITPAVIDSCRNFEKNGLWEKVEGAALKNFQLRPGDIGISRNEGHMMIADGSGQFLDANSSGRKSLDIAFYQIPKGNVDKVYRLKQPPVDTIA